MRAVDGLVEEHIAIGIVRKDADRHAPGALAREHPVGPVLDHPAQAVLARLSGTKRVSSMPLSARLRAWSPSPKSLSMWTNHCGVLRKMIGFFERQECG
jgi:hypothetical protein